MTTITPVDTSSFTPPQLAAFGAAAKLGSGVPTTNGVQNGPPAPTKPTASPVPSTAPTLSTNFAPQNTGSITAPAVVTSEPAENNIQHLTTTANTANQDTQALAQHQAATVAATPPTTPVPAGTNPTAPANTSNTPTDISSQINDILSGLGEEEKQTATPTPGQQSELDTAQAALGFDQQTQNQVGTALDSLAAGTTPLTPGEQAQVNDVQLTYSGALKAAQDYAQNVAGGAAAANAASGLQMYSPALAMSNIHSAIITGADKIGAVNSRITSAMTKLTTSLQNADYKQANTLYNQISKDITTRQNEIDKINTTITNETKQMHTDALNVAKANISALTSQATRDATASYRAQQLILSNARLSDTERQQAFNDLQKANTARTASERSAQTLSQFAATFVPGATMSDGTPTVDENGYITPTAFRAAIADAPAEGLTRADFIKQFGSMLYSDPKAGINGRAYGLTPAEVKLITGALPAVGS